MLALGHIHPDTSVPKAPHRVLTADHIYYPVTPNNPAAKENPLTKQLIATTDIPEISVVAGKEEAVVYRSGVRREQPSRRAHHRRPGLQYPTTPTHEELG